MRARLPLLSLTAGLCASCAHHVVLDRPPPPAAPLEHRRAWYQEHALEKPERGDLAVRTRLFEEHPTVARRRADLRNGTPIERVEDLLPLVPEESATAQAMARAVDARGRADALMGAGAAIAGLGVLGGFALVGADLGIFPGTEKVPTQETVAPPLTIAGISTAAGGALIGGFLVAFGSLARDDEDDATSAAFKSYEADLRAALALDAAPTVAPSVPSDATP